MGPSSALMSHSEFVCTLRAAVWLNVAECELNAMIRQCLNRRMDSVDVLRPGNTTRRKLCPMATVGMPMSRPSSSRSSSTSRRDAVTAQ